MDEKGKQIENFMNMVRSTPYYRDWVSEVKKAYKGKCFICGTDEHIDTHHKDSLRILIDMHKIPLVFESIEKFGRILYDIENGVVLCESHHYLHHWWLKARLYQCCKSRFNLWCTQPEILCELQRRQYMETLSNALLKGFSREYLKNIFYHMIEGELVSCGELYAGKDERGKVYIERIPKRIYIGDFLSATDLKQLKYDPANLPKNLTTMPSPKPNDNNEHKKTEEFD